MCLIVRGAYLARGCVPQREWVCGWASVQSVRAFVCVCACLLLIVRGVPKYRVATLLNQMREKSASSCDDHREEQPPPPPEVNLCSPTIAV